MGSVFERRDPPTTNDIPSWVDSRQRDIVLTCIITPIFTAIFVGLRLYARKFITRQVGWDDWLAGFTLILCVVYSILLSLWTNHGGGMHQDDLNRLDMMEEYYLWINISSPVYIFACMGYKVSILLLYLRLFSLQKWTIRATWFTLFVTIGYLIANFTVQLTGCRPLRKFWESDLPGECIDFVSSDIAFGSLNVITDFMIFALPLPALWQSTLSWKDKFGASLVFLTGAIAFVAALVRFQYAIKDLTAVDRTYLAGLTFLWMVLEINTGLICSCGPALKPLYRKFFHPETLERYAPQPVRHALNNARKHYSAWNVTAAAEYDSQATLTNNSSSSGILPKFQDPWSSTKTSKKGMGQGTELELQDVGGILGATKSHETLQPAQATHLPANRHVAAHPSRIARADSNDTLYEANTDDTMAHMQRQTSFV